MGANRDSSSSQWLHKLGSERARRLEIELQWPVANESWLRLQCDELVSGSRTGGCVGVWVVGGQAAGWAFGSCCKWDGSR